MLARLDLYGVAKVRGLPHPRALDTALIALSRATDHSAGWFALSLAGFAVNAGRRRRWASAAARLIAVEVGVRALKRVRPRRRPLVAGLPPLAPVTSDLSFPSAHTAAAVAAMSAFDELVPPGLLRGLVAATAFSRLYLGLHYPSDVLAGALVGRACAALTGALKPRRAQPTASTTSTRSWRQNHGEP